MGLGLGRQAAVSGRSLAASPRSTGGEVACMYSVGVCVRCVPRRPLESSSAALWVLTTTGSHAAHHIHTPVQGIHQAPGPLKPSASPALFPPCAPPERPPLLAPPHPT